MGTYRNAINRAWYSRNMLGEAPAMYVVGGPFSSSNQLSDSQSWIRSQKNRYQTNIPIMSRTVRIPGRSQRNHSTAVGAYTCWMSGRCRVTVLYPQFRQMMASTDGICWAQNGHRGRTSSDCSRVYLFGS